MTVSYLSPIAEPGVAITAYESSFDPNTFHGVLGFAANSQPGSQDFLASLADYLLPSVPGARAYFEDKGDTPKGSAVPFDDDELNQVLRACDALILAYGHCGACTSSTVRDAVQVARRGRPVVAVVAPRFEAEARQVARAAGMPGVPIFVLPGSMTQLSADERRVVAEKVAGEIVDCLTGQR